MKVIRIEKKSAPVWEDPRKVEGELLSPDRFGLKEVRLYKKSLGSYGYAGQFQQSPAPGDGGFVKKDWFKVWQNVSPPKLKCIISSFDTAFKEKEQNDYSVCTTWGIFSSDQADAWISHGNQRDSYDVAILLSLWRDRVSYPELRRRAFLISQNYTNTGVDEKPAKKSNRPDIILIEDKASGQSLIQDFYAAGINNVYPQKPKGDKIQRFHLVSPLIENGLIYLAKHPKKENELRPSSKILLDELLTFPRAKHDDIVDTLIYFLDYAKKNHLLSLTYDPKGDDFGDYFPDKEVSFF